MSASILLLLSVFMASLGIQPLSSNVDTKFNQKVPLIKNNSSITNISYKFNNSIIIINNHEDYAQSYILVDGSASESILQSKNQDSRSLASITKLMTALVSISNYQLTDTIIAPESTKDIQPSIAGLLPGDAYTVENLLKALLIPSGNDAAEVLASKIGREEFISKMNTDAKILGLNSLYYEDPTGLSSKNVGAARDIALLLKVVETNPALNKIMKTNQISISDITNTNSIELKSTNLTLSDIPVSGITGGKTGYTDEAGYNLAVSTKELDGRTLYAVILGAKDNTREGAAKAVSALIQKVRAATARQ